MDQKAGTRRLVLQASPLWGDGKGSGGSVPCMSGKIPGLDPTQNYHLSLESHGRPMNSSSLLYLAPGHVGYFSAV